MGALVEESLMREGSGKVTQSHRYRSWVKEALNSLIREADRCVALMQLPSQAITHHASLYAYNLVILVALGHSD
jgi:hypothetical protein